MPKLNRIVEYVRNVFRKKTQRDIIKKNDGTRIIVMEPGDSCLILKENGKSIIVDSGSDQLNRGDEIICMVWCYLANPDFVKILDQMFSDIVDEVNADKRIDANTVGRSGSYYDSVTEEGKA